MSSKDNKQPDFLKNLEKKVKSRSDKKPTPRKGTPNNKKKSSWNQFTFFLLIVLAVFTFYSLINKEPDTKFNKIAYSEFIKEVKEGKVEEILIIENLNRIEFKRDGIDYSTRIPYTDNNLVATLLANQVKVFSETREESKLFLILINWLPWIILMVFFWFMISRQMKGRGGEAFSFGKSPASLIDSKDVKERFSDVKGCEEAIHDLEDIVGFLKNPKKFINLGARIPKGILLVGAPGTGKTLLARAVAGEANVPFFSISGSDFVEMFVGVGASRVRDLFENGKKNSPCIIFIDEIDAVGRARGSGFGGGHDEREQTLNQLLVEMDGFKSDQGIIVMAATNRSDVLDRALLRPGRFDRQVTADIPDVKGRAAILKIHAKKIKLNPKADLQSIARGTVGFTGADLENLINEAALMAAKENLTVVEIVHLEHAKDKVMLGPERRSIFITDDEKRNTAYHEAGHALVSLLVPKARDLHKVTIIPRGRALGVTHFLPEDGKLTMSKSAIESELRVLYGGRVAEEIIFKDVSNGAVNDIERATQIARAMVCEWGFSRLGAIFYGDQNQMQGYTRTADRPVNGNSPDMSVKIDMEVKRILDEAYKETVSLLKKNVAKLKKLSEKLIEQETMAIDEIRAVLNIKNTKSV